MLSLRSHVVADKPADLSTTKTGYGSPTLTESRLNPKLRKAPSDH